ncbi:hypothetical protein ACVZG9_004191, partial [Cronobacter sakazakii]
SREQSGHMKATLWRTEPIHRPGIYSLIPTLFLNEIEKPRTAGAASLTRPTNNTILIVGWVSEAHPPFSPHAAHKKTPGKPGV